MVDWTEKYRPKNIHQIVGNHNQIRKLESWAQSWKKGKPTRKAVVLSGKPGIGKTSAAYTIAYDFNWLPIELNASDARNAQSINAVATAGATHQTFSDSGQFISTKRGGRKLIIIDEADNLFERSRKSEDTGKDYGDKDGKKTIVKTVQVTSQPVIIIVNDDYQLFKGSGASLRKDCLHLKMYTVKPNEIMQLLKRICTQENITVDANVLFSISESCEGDIRSAVRDLQSICMNKKHVSSLDAEVLGRRDRSQLIFDVLREIFQTKDIAVIKHHIQMVQEDPRMLLLWIAENLPQSYSSYEDISQAYTWISTADRYLGRTFRRSQFGLWSYACDLSTLGVAFSKNGRVRKHRYSFPSWLKQTSKYKHVLSAQQSIVKKLSLYHHCSMKKARSYHYPHMKLMLSNDEELFLSMVKKLSLTEDEAVGLIGKKAKNILKKQKQIEKSKEEKNLGQQENKDNKEEKQRSLKQQSLGSF